MHLSLSPKNIVAFLALLFVCHEAHELIHTVVGYVLCGCWGERDFRGWEVCEACSPTVNTTWITLAGPLLSYGLMWVAFFLMGASRTVGQRAFGWVLFFANLPLGRLLPVLEREGDESVITRNVFEQVSMTFLSWGTELAIVFLLIVPVAVRAWLLLAPKHRGWVFTGFLVFPLLTETVLMNQGANGLLQNGVLAGSGILGSPLLVNVWNVGWLLVLSFTFRHLYLLLVPPPSGVSGDNEVTELG